MRLIRNGIWLFAPLAAVLVAVVAMGQQPTIQSPGPLTDAGKELALGHYAHAKALFATLLRSSGLSAHDHTESQLGLADAELGLHEYEAAELDYRAVVFAQPELWIAHKNLVIVEAALGRWEEFDRERALLRGARDRQAPGIRREDADVIDKFNTLTGSVGKGNVRNGQHWIVREYYEPLGRAGARYNFESFAPDGRVREYLSLESADVLPPKTDVPVVIGGAPSTGTPAGGFVLNFYTGHAHGTIARYAKEPSYERIRADVRSWLARPVNRLP